MTLSSLPVIDVSLICFLLAFVSIGFWFGFIHMAGAIVGMVVGILVAGMYYQGLADWIFGITGGNLNLIRVLVFFGLLVLVTRVVGLLVVLADKIFRIAAIIPFLKTFNRLLGAVLGLVEGLIVIGLLVYFSSRLPFGAMFELALRSSKFAPFFHLFGKLLSPLLPEALRLMQPVLS